MRLTVNRRLLASGLIGTVMAITIAACSNSTDPATGSTSGGSNRADIDRGVNAAMADLMATNPAAKALAANAKAVLIFPQITKAGLGLGGLYGTGAMREGQRTVAYYNIVAANFGYQIGAQSFSQAYFFNTAESLETFKKTKGFEAGAGVTAVAADFGANAEVTSSTMQRPVVVVTWGQSGLMAGAVIEGTKVSEINP